METIPFASDNPIFRRVEEVGRMANLSRDEMHKYESELKVYRDFYSTVSYARDQGVEYGLAEGRAEGRAEGLEEGREEEKNKLVKGFFSQGISPDVIAKAAGLSVDEVNKILATN